MKKLLSWLLTLMLILCCPICLAEEGFTFRQGFDYDFPPYSYLTDDGSMGGFDIEVCKAVCEYLGWNHEPVSFSWDVKDAELDSGSCDCIWSGFTQEGHEDAYAWSIPYCDNDLVILTVKDIGINTLDDLMGKIVGVQTATSALELLQGERADLAATFAELVIAETYTMAINDLLAGAIDAIAIDITTCRYNIANRDNPDEFLILDETLGKEHYAVAFRLTDTSLRDQVNGALIALAKDGTLERIAASNPDYASIQENLSITAENADELAAALEDSEKNN